MPTVHLVGYEGGLPPDTHEKHPDSGNERQLGERISVSIDTLPECSGEQHLLHPTGDSRAEEMAEDFGARLNLVSVEFEPVEWNDNAMHDFLAIGTNVKNALDASEIVPSDRSQVLVLTPTLAIAKILGREVGDIQPGTVHFAACISSQMDEVIGHIRERELREG